MPISPANMPLYPGGSIKSPEWLAIRQRIQHRAGDCCEGCGVANGAVGIRLPPDRAFMELPGFEPGDLVEVLGWFDRIGLATVGYKVIRIVCTTAHLDGGLSDHSDDNLAFWCQQCHNSHDAPSRAVNAAATRKARKPITLIDLMEA
jgi:hypothetical protein